MAIKAECGQDTERWIKVIVQSGDSDPIQTWACWLNASGLGGLLRVLDVNINDAAIRRALGRKVKARKPER